MVDQLSDGSLAIRSFAERHQQASAGEKGGQAAGGMVRAKGAFF